MKRFDSQQKKFFLFMFVLMGTLFIWYENYSFITKLGDFCQDRVNGVFHKFKDTRIIICNGFDLETRSMKLVAFSRAEFEAWKIDRSGEGE